MITKETRVIDLTVFQLQQLIGESVKNNSPSPIPSQSEPADQLFTVPQAAEFLNLAVPTIYSMVSKSELPVMKRSKRLYFSKAELTEYIKGGRKKTNSEIDAEAEVYLSNYKNKKG